MGNIEINQLSTNHKLVPSQRDPKIDSAKAIGIVLMVLGHCGIPWTLRDFIFSFHMPLFFIFSGYFYNERETSVVLKKGYTQLIRPYLITAFASIILCLVAQNYKIALQKVVGMIYGAGSGYVLGYKLPVIGPIWFLLALFWCKVIYNILYKATKYTFLITFVISTISFIFGKYVMALPFGLLYGLCSLVFYSMGHYWKKKITKPIGIPCLVIGIIIWILCIWKGHLEIATYDCSLYPLSMIAAFVGTYVTYLLSSKIPKCLTPIMNWLGNHTLLILCYHTLYFYILSILRVYIFEPNSIVIRRKETMVICFILSFGLPLVHWYIMRKIQQNKKQGPGNLYPYSTKQPSESSEG